MQYVTVLYCTVLYCAVQYCTVLYCTVLYCTVLYSTVLYCTVLYCTVRYLMTSEDCPADQTPFSNFLTIQLQFHLSSHSRLVIVMIPISFLNYLSLCVNQRQQLSPHPIIFSSQSLFTTHRITFNPS